MQRPKTRQKRDPRLQKPQISPSLLLHFPFPEQRLQILRLVKAKLSTLTVVSTVRVLLRDLDQDIADLEELLRQSRHRESSQQRTAARQPANSLSRRPQSSFNSTNRGTAPRSTSIAAGQILESPGEEELGPFMSGALPAGAQPPRQDSPNLVRNKTSFEEMQLQEARGHLIAAAHHRDHEPKLSQIWRRGPRAFINDIIRREVGRRLREGEEVRILDKDTIALLDQGLGEISSHVEEDEQEDRGRRLHHRETPRPREEPRARGQALDPPLQQANSSTTSSVSSRTRPRSSAPSTGMAVVEGLTSADAIPQTAGADFHPYRQSMVRPSNIEARYVRYGPDSLGSRRFENDVQGHRGQQTREDSREDGDRPSRSNSTLRGEAHDCLHPTRATATDAQSRSSHGHSVGLMDGVSSTVASTRNLATWTEAAGSGTSMVAGSIDEEMERGSGVGGVTRRKKAGAKVSEEQRRGFYQLGRRRT